MAIKIDPAVGPLGPGRARTDGGYAGGGLDRCMLRNPHRPHQKSDGYDSGGDLAREASRERATNVPDVENEDA